MATTPLRITLDGKEYPCKEFVEAQKADKIERVWPDGFWDGIGESRVRSPRRCLYAHFMDLTSPPYVRLIPAPVSIGVSSGPDVATPFPFYFLQGRQPNATNVVYMLIGSYRVKINRDTNAIIYTTQDNASDIYGRSTYFESGIYLAKGDQRDAATLTIANGSPDTITAITGIKAKHFAKLQDQGVSKLARSFLNFLQLSPDGSTWSTTSFEVGDSSLPTSDMLESQGEIIVIKPDGPYKFDPQGNSLPLQRFVGSNLTTSVFNGSNSHGHGTYAYWVDQAALWRILGDNVLPVGFESDPQYFATANVDIVANSQWRSVTAYGRWLYATRSGQLWQGFIKDDGTVQWYGAIWNESTNSALRCNIDAGVGTGPALWLASSTTPGFTTFYRFDLQLDGSMRSVIGSSRGAQSGSVPTFRFGTDDFDKPDRTKQLRRFWVITEGFVAGDILQLQAELDGAAAQNVGTTITTNGLIEKVPTATSSGTVLASSDSFREARIGFKFTGFAGTSDPRIRAMGVECLTPPIYKATIELTPESVRGYQRGIQGMLQDLRELQNGQRVELKAPELDATRTSYITSVQEKVVGKELDTVGYEVEVLAEVMTIPSSVA